jgi:hypothetical protein
MPPREGYRLELADEFHGAELDLGKWLPSYLPQWSTRERAAARYRLDGGHLYLQITGDQEPWCPAHDGGTRVSSLQTGVHAGPVGSRVGQHRFHPDLTVVEAQASTRLYTPQYGYFELRARAVADRDCMVALWMIGFEDAPERSGEILVFEIFGRDVEPGSAGVGMGVRPFADPELVDGFEKVPLDIDVTEFHVYAAEWTPTHVDFHVDGRRVKTVGQSPAYPMQFMLDIYQFAGADRDARPPGSYPVEFAVDYFRAYQPLAGYPAR